jgi:hypothetical protein
MWGGEFIEPWRYLHTFGQGGFVIGKTRDDGRKQLERELYWEWGLFIDCRACGGRL